MRLLETLRLARGKLLRWRIVFARSHDRSLKLTGGPAEIIKFAFVLDFLTLGQFQRLEQFIEFLHHPLEGFYDAINIFHGFAHSGNLFRRRRW